jgi:dihydrofolate synthase/folylpolyglutamate synthase
VAADGARVQPMDYASALAYISSTGRFGIKLGLERTRALLDEVGAPDRGMRGALVAGTNGKGSTCALLASILRRSGQRVAEMPKPHLTSYTERVVVAGRPITERLFARAVSAMVPAVQRVTLSHGAPTEFEILTTLALRYARQRRADLLVCEVGMGGRLDATNITDLGVKVITSIALDHQQYLGDTIEAIAREKAGIIRAGDIVVAGPLPGAAAEVVEARCQEVGAELLRAGRDFAAGGVRSSWQGTALAFDVSPGGWLRPVKRLASSLLGAHQADNAAVAVAAAQVIARRHGIEIDEAATREGLAGACWPGRLERFPGDPAVVIDGGHNPAAVQAVLRAITDLGVDQPPVVLFGAMADKDVAGMLELLPAAWPAVFTAVPEPRAVAAADLLELSNSRRRSRADTGGPSPAPPPARIADTAEADIAAALAAAKDRAATGGIVLVLGSLYLAGAVRRLLTVPAATR